MDKKTNSRKDQEIPYQQKKANGVIQSEFIEKQNQGHNVKKQALGPNTER